MAAVNVGQATTAVMILSLLTTCNSSNLLACLLGSLLRFVVICHHIELTLPRYHFQGSAALPLAVLFMASTRLPFALFFMCATTTGHVRVVQRPRLLLLESA